MFKKVLAKYYHKWYKDCLISAAVCTEKGDSDGTKKYLKDADRYKEIIDNNEKAIQFFSIGDNAYKRESALPVEFRGYE